MPDRSYEGDPLDGTMQHITEAPYRQEGETVGATDEPEGRETTENVPIPAAAPPETEGQATLDDYTIALEDQDE